MEAGAPTIFTRSALIQSVVYFASTKLLFHPVIDIVRLLLSQQVAAEALRSLFEAHLHDVGINRE